MDDDVDEDVDVGVVAKGVEEQDKGGRWGGRRDVGGRASFLA